MIVPVIVTVHLAGFAIEVGAVACRLNRQWQLPGAAKAPLDRPAAGSNRRVAGARGARRLHGVQWPLRLPLRHQFAATRKLLVRPHERLGSKQTIEGRRQHPRGPREDGTERIAREKPGWLGKQRKKADDAHLCILKVSHEAPVDEALVKDVDEGVVFDMGSKTKLPVRCFHAPFFLELGGCLPVVCKAEMVS